MSSTTADLLASFDASVRDYLYPFMASRGAAYSVGHCDFNGWPGPSSISARAYRELQGSFFWWINRFEIEGCTLDIGFGDRELLVEPLLYYRGIDHHFAPSELLSAATVRNPQAASGAIWIRSVGFMKKTSMKENRATTGFIGIAAGAIALLVAIVHFWTGPLSPQPSLERTVAEKAVALKDATIAALKGEAIKEQKSPSNIDLDQGVRIGTSVLGGLALILGVVSFANREPMRAGAGAAFLGAAAIAFQFAVIALGAIVLAILIAAVIAQIGIE